MTGAWWSDGDGRALRGGAAVLSARASSGRVSPAKLPQVSTLGPQAPPRQAPPQQTGRGAQQQREPVWDLSGGAVKGGRTTTNARGTIELITSSADAAAGGELWVALRFQLAPGWHIYWRNPGDSGGPPVVRWQLPPGVTVGEFEWPVPARIPLGPLVNFGYEESIVLPAKVTFAPGTAGGPLRIGGFVRWLICKDVCVSDETTLGISLPLGAQDKELAAQWAGDIQAARRAVPKAAPGTWKSSARLEGDEFLLTVVTDRPLASAVFFPLEPRQIENAAPQPVSVSGWEIRLRLRKSEQLVKAPAVLRGVLAFPSGSAVSIAAPVVAGKGA
jgi:thiol:disulfide interchange protein DsbD